MSLRLELAGNEREQKCFSVIVQVPCHEIGLNILDNHPPAGRIQS